MLNNILKRYEEDIKYTTGCQLIIDGSNIYEIPDLTNYSTLKILYIQNTLITKLPELPQSLVILSLINNTNLQHRDFIIPKLDNLESLYIEKCKVKQLPDISHLTKLTYLNCNDNKIIELRNLPDSIKILKCMNNNITNLLPFIKHCKNLIMLECEGNDLNYFEIENYKDEIKKK